MIDELKKQVCEANLDLDDKGLVILTWGNVSAIDRDEGLVAIKPSGISYDEMKPSDMVVVDLDGKVVEGKLNPSTDTASHLALYNAWEEVGGIVHTHSLYGTMFSQACRSIPCLGTTHADTFYGEVPVTRSLTKKEIEEAYELNTGNVIVERFSDINPMEVPGVVVANHAPFAWGATAEMAVTNALVLETVAQMAQGTFQINPDVKPVEQHILDKHYYRKHGPDAYYGQ